MEIMTIMTVKAGVEYKMLFTHFVFLVNLSFLNFVGMLLVFCIFGKKIVTYT